MIAFVTGGTGFIGSHLVDRLLADESVSEIRCLVRNKEKWLKGKAYKKIQGDLFNKEALLKGLEGVDVLYHIAGVVKASTIEEFTKANVKATTLLLERAMEAGVKKVIILSSLAAAGPSNGDPVTEKDPLKPVSMYGESKKQMEEAIHEVNWQSLSISIIRPPAVYGPREDQIYTWFRMANHRLCPIVGNGEHPRISLVYVSDLVDGIQLAASDLTTGIQTWFITGPEISTWNQIKMISSNVLGKRCFPLYVRPDWVKQLSSVVESTASLFGIYPVFNREKAKEMILEWTCSSKKAENELRYHPKTSLEEGISRTIHWYQKHHWL